MMEVIGEHNALAYANDRELLIHDRKLHVYILISKYKTMKTRGSLSLWGKGCNVYYNDFDSKITSRGVGSNKMVPFSMNICTNSIHWLFF